ncbi:MAG: hypothetical protein D6753_07220, partial [Planctomycetota bacterium]
MTRKPEAETESGPPSGENAVLPDPDSAGRTVLNMAGLSVASLAQLVVQFLFFQQLAATFAFQEQADALAAALVVPTVLAAMLIGSLGYVLVPELVAQFQSDAGSERGWQLGWYTGAVTALLASAVSLG